MNSVEDVFNEEAAELLESLEAALLELDDEPDDTESVDSAFRAMHTIKGSGSMFGFDKLASFTHHLEDAFDMVRSGDLVVTKELISIALSSLDHIRSLLEDKNSTPTLEAEGVVLLNQLAKLLPADEALSELDDDVTAVLSESEKLAATSTYRIRVTPAVDALSHGMDPLPILRELTELGAVNIITMLSNVPKLAELDPESCHLTWNLILTTEKGRNSIDDAFIFVMDDWSISVEVIEQDSHWSDEGDEKPLGEIILGRGDATSAQVEDAIQHIEDVVVQRKRTGDVLIEKGSVSREQVQAALAEQQIVRAQNKNRKGKQVLPSVKVPAERLDTLMDLMGELVIAQSRLNQSASVLMDSDLINVAEEIERLSTELRDNTLGLRMLPIGTTFARFRRLVRDLSNELGKDIELVTEGAETELDKTVIDSLADPLVHLIRNSIDHGIELPEVREAAGKVSKGTVHLSATYSESNVVIKIKDDGAGIDATVIRAKAIERGILKEDSILSAEELYNLVFEAGFSTAKTVTNVSGRGVGMDVVKRSIEALRGKVWIDSELGKGSTVTVELPLTLAIIDGLLMKVNGDYFVVPLSLVEECVELTTDDSEKRNGNRLIEVRGETVPYVRLREWFGQEGEVPHIEQIVVTRIEGTGFGLAVDEVIGQHQTVIKSLGKLHENTKGLLGATILGDGTVALIMDVPNLLNDVELVSKNDTLRG
jgi:two-component system chemotaxis sensor kinase CheA